MPIYMSIPTALDPAYFSPARHAQSRVLPRVGLTGLYDRLTLRLLMTGECTRRAGFRGSKSLAVKLC